MSRENFISGASSGRVTKGLRRNTLAEQTLHFVQAELLNWRDDPERESETSEERLNAQLCKYLNVTASERFPMIYFHHEEKQPANRRVDFSALPRKAQPVGDQYCTKYKPFIVFEGKRLPAPRRNREREYVTGGNAKSGGIQRFKLGLHGNEQDLAVMVGYIQSGEPSFWLSNINQWIKSLDKTVSPGGESWSQAEQLKQFTSETTHGIAQTWSSHARIGNVISKSITLCHLWVKMSSRSID